MPSSTETQRSCGRPGCNKKLRTSNTSGVCWSGCLSPDAPASIRADSSSSASGSAPRSDVMRRFKVVATALGKDPNAILEEAAKEWLSALEKAVE